jgi:hypothetical protein
LSVDVVLADRGAVRGSEAELEKAAAQLHASVVLADVAASGGTKHDPVRLAEAYRRIFRSGGSIQLGGGAQWR